MDYVRSIIKKYKSSIVIVGIIGIISTISVIGFIDKNTCFGDDFFYHISRIKWLSESLIEGDFPAKIYTTALNGYGYGGGLFYPDIFLIIPAVLVLLGVNIEIAYNTFIILCTFATAATMYYCAKKIGKSKLGALTATIIYILAHYRLYNIYTRAALGEIQAFIFIPLVIYGLYNIIIEEDINIWPFVIGFTGILMSSVVVCFVVVVIVVLILIINYKKILKNKERLLAILKSGLILIALNLWFILPLLEQMLSGKFAYNEPWTIPTENFVTVLSILKNEGPTIGIIGLVVCFITFFNKKNKNKYPSKQFLLISLVCIISTTQIFPWRLFYKVADLIQFPWRMNIIAWPFLCFNIAIMISNINTYRYRKYFSSILILITTAIALVYISNINYIKLVWNQQFFSIGKGAEYLPSGSYVKDEDRKVVKSLQANGFIKDGRSLFAFVEGGGERVIEAPLLYYKGYDCELIDNNNDTKSLEVSKSRNGFLKVLVPENSYGMIKVVYRGTIIQKLSGIISIITYILILIIVSKKRSICLNKRYSKKV